ncbi:kinetochore Sim4 complex subunit FTA2-domain-containing protein [Xylariaceae sp. FL0255]|nr:kinetochore Sim4 complex subunit FTA2-domain-containing protein [Xylariaceae sp. FL0255]
MPPHKSAPTRSRGNSGHADGVRLPPDGGPSICEFKHSDATIEWVKRLDDSDREDTEAFVYQVRIASQNYALKVFKFSSPKSNSFYWGTKLQKTLPLKEAIFYTDSFYAECRAYGRIEDGRVDRDSRSSRIRRETAVKCHGYLLLNDDHKQWLLDQGHDLEEEVLDEDVRQALEGETRVRAIVKHLDTRPHRLHAGNIARAWTSVQTLNRSLKIYNMDIKADNFIGFRLVDFGSSWTEPHAILSYLDKAHKSTAKDWRSRDTQNFEDMIEEEEISTRLRVVPTSRHNLRKPWAEQELLESRG